MLCARINVIQPQNRNLITYLLPLPDKKRRQLWLNEIKRVDWTETIVKNARVCSTHFLSEKAQSIVFCCYGCVWRFLASHEYVVYEIMSVCMGVKQQTHDLYIIICNCIYIVVINCGWNNNVAVKIVPCWNWNVFTSSSWLDRHGEFVFTIHVRHDPPHSNNPVRSSILWVRV